MFKDFRCDGKKADGLGTVRARRSFTGFYISITVHLFHAKLGRSETYVEQSNQEQVSLLRQTRVNCLGSGKGAFLGFSLINRSAMCSGSAVIGSEEIHPISCWTSFPKSGFLIRLGAPYRLRQPAKNSPLSSGRQGIWPASARLFNTL